MKNWQTVFVGDFIFILIRGADAVHDEYQISTLLKAFIENLQKFLNVCASIRNISPILTYFINVMQDFKASIYFIRKNSKTACLAISHSDFNKISDLNLTSEI